LLGTTTRKYPTFMISVTLRAHYDGEHIVLDQPFEIPVNAPLTVTVLAPAASEHDRERERASWAALSAWNRPPSLLFFTLHPGTAAGWRRPPFSPPGEQSNPNRLYSGY